MKLSLIAILTLLCLSIGVAQPPPKPVVLIADTVKALSMLKGGLQVSTSSADSAIFATKTFTNSTYAPLATTMTKAEFGDSAAAYTLGIGTLTPGYTVRVGSADSIYSSARDTVGLAASLAGKMDVSAVGDSINSHSLGVNVSANQVVMAASADSIYSIAKVPMANLDTAIIATQYDLTQVTGTGSSDSLAHKYVDTTGFSDTTKVLGTNGTAWTMKKMALLDTTGISDTTTVVGTNGTNYVMRKSAMLDTTGMGEAGVQGAGKKLTITSAGNILIRNDSVGTSSDSSVYATKYYGGITYAIRADTTSWLPTWADIEAKGYGVGGGDIEGVSVSAPVTGGGTSGTVTISVDTTTNGTGLATLYQLGLKAPLTDVLKNADSTSIRNYSTVLYPQRTDTSSWLATKYDILKQDSLLRDPTGFFDRTSSTITFTNDRKFLIAQTGSGFDVYSRGRKISKTRDSITVANVTGLHYIYFDSLGVLSQGTDAWVINSNNIPVATVYWSVAMDAGILGDERHGFMQGVTHEYLHETVGAKYAFGLAGTFTPDGDSTTISSGEWYDEDIEYLPGDQDSLRIFYRSGSDWLWTSAQGAYFDTLGTVPAYDDAGTRTEVGVAKFSMTWIFVTNDIEYPVVALMGQGEYLTEALANAVDPSTLSLGVLPIKESLLLYRVIWQRDGSVITWKSTTDYRALRGGSVLNYVATDHASLSNLSYAASGHTGFLGAADSTSIRNYSGALYAPITSSTAYLKNADSTSMRNYSNSIYAQRADTASWLPTWADIEAKGYGTGTGTNDADSIQGKPVSVYRPDGKSTLNYDPDSTGYVHYGVLSMDTTGVNDGVGKKLTIIDGVVVARNDSIPPTGQYLVPGDSTSIRNYSETLYAPITSSTAYLKNADSTSIRNYSSALYLKNADSTTIKNGIAATYAPIASPTLTGTTTTDNLKVTGTLTAAVDSLRRKYVDSTGFSDTTNVLSTDGSKWKMRKLQQVDTTGFSDATSIMGTDGSKYVMRKGYTLDTTGLGAAGTTGAGKKLTITSAGSVIIRNDSLPPAGTYLTPSDSTSIRNYSSALYLKNADSTTIKNGIAATYAPIASPTLTGLTTNDSLHVKGRGYIDSTLQVGGFQLNGATASITATRVGQIPLSVRASAGGAPSVQYLQTWENSAGSVYASISQTGVFTTYGSIQNYEFIAPNETARMIFGTTGQETGRILFKTGAWDAQLTRVAVSTEGLRIGSGVGALNQSFLIRSLWGGMDVRDSANTDYAQMNVMNFSSVYSSSQGQGGGFTDNPITTYRVSMNKGDSGTVQISGSGIFGWAAGGTTNQRTTAADLGLSRLRANVLGIGNGTVGDSSGTIVAANVKVTGTLTAAVDSIRRKYVDTTGFSDTTKVLGTNGTAWTMKKMALLDTTGISDTTTVVGTNGTNYVMRKSAMLDTTGMGEAGVQGAGKKLTITSAGNILIRNDSLPPAGTYLIPADSTSIRNYSGALYLKNADSTTIRNHIDADFPSKASFPVVLGAACSDESTALTASTSVAKYSFRMPFAMTLTSIRASAVVCPTDDTLLVDVHETGTTLMSGTKVHVDATEYTSTTAGVAYVLTDTDLADDALIEVFVDRIGSAVAGAGLKIWLIGTRIL